MITAMLAITALSVVPVAQAHPCDAVLLVNPTLTTPVVAGFCHDVTPISARVYFEGVQVWSGTPVKVTASPNTAGMFYFETPSINALRGSHVATVDVTDANGVSPLSDPYSFSIKGKPMKVRVHGGSD